MNFLQFAALLAILATAAHASSYVDTCGVESFNASGSNSLSFITLTFALVTLAIALAYMYSKIKEDPASGTWAKDEGYSLLISALLFAGLLAFFTASCRLAESYSGNSPFAASQNYLDSLLRGYGQNALRQLTYASINNQMEATYYRYFGFTPFFGSGSAFHADRRAHSAQKEFLIDLYAPVVVSLTAQKYALQAVEWFAASVLLPFAFVLRLLPPTREYGNMLIAGFFPLYIAVPTTYAMSGRVFTNGILNTEPYCVDCGINMFSTYGLDSASAAPQETILYRIGATIPQAVFIPNLAIIIGVTCAMSLSKALRAIAF